MTPRVGIAVLSVLAASCLPGAGTAAANEFVVTSCGESPTAETTGWTVSAPTATLDAGTQCPPVLNQPGPSGNASKHTGIYLTDRLAAPTDTPAGAAVSATFNAASGTTVTRARIWRWYQQTSDANWRMLGATLEGATLDSCTIVNQGCSVGNPNYAPSTSDMNDNTVADFTGLSSAGIRYSLTCQSQGGGVCSNGSTLYRASLSLFGSKLTINDPSAPAQQIPVGALWNASGFQRGSLALTAAASDNTGISTTQLLVDGAAASVSSRSCDYSRPAPCTDEPGAALTLDTATVADGPHTIAVRTLDAAANPATFAQDSQLLVDNHAPNAPLNLRVPDGASTRSTNAWTLAWELPPDAGSPVVRAHYSICPAGSTSSCTSAQADGQDITSLPAFALPGPGAWDVRVSLEDQLGQTAAANAASITLTYAPPSGPPATSTSTTPPQTTPPPTTSTGTTPPPPPRATRVSAALRAERVTRSGSLLRVSGTRRRSATGKLTVRVSQRIAGRTLRVTRRVQPVKGRYAVQIRLSGRLARASRVAVVIVYAGDKQTRPATLRVSGPGPKRSR